MGRKPAKAKSRARRPVAPKSGKTEASRVRDLEKRLAEALKGKAEAPGQLQTRDRDLAEAHEQQMATSEILRVISSSPTDVLPTCEAIATAATRLWAAQDSGVVRFDGALMHLIANDGFTAEEREILRAQFPRLADRGMVTGRAIVTRAVAHIAAGSRHAARHDRVSRRASSPSRTRARSTSTPPPPSASGCARPTAPTSGSSRRSARSTLARARD
jgi:hypothetical protein